MDDVDLLGILAVDKMSVSFSACEAPGGVWMHHMRRGMVFERERVRERERERRRERERGRGGHQIVGCLFMSCG